MHVGVRGQLEMLVLHHSLAFVASVCAFVCESSSICTCMYTMWLCLRVSGFTCAGTCGSQRLTLGIFTTYFSCPAPYGDLPTSTSPWEYRCL